MNGSSITNTAETFDLTNAAGAVALLRRVHVAALPPEVKNQLRDAVFSTQNNSLITDHQAVQDLFAQFGMTVTLPTTAGDASAGKVTIDPMTTAEEITPEEPPKQPTRTGFGRPAPRFSAPSKESHETDNTETETKGASSLPEEKQTPVMTTRVASPDVAASPVVAAEPSTVADPATRIKEIKHEVNSMVGNPVNLIDIDNKVGREYMNALLDAMKKVNIGVAASDMERAMQRLETAFADVEVTMRSRATETTPSAPAVEEKESPVKPVESSPVANIPEEPTPEVVEEKQVTKEEEIVPAAKPENVTAEMATEDISRSGEEPVVPLSSVANVDTSSPQTKAPKEPEGPAEAAEQTAPAVQPGFTAVAKEKQLKQLMQEQEQEIKAKDSEQAAEVAANPLFASDVNTGLEQLLSEWKLFKSSGIFGTGPGGVEHPLYKKLAPITMAAVMSGRFEGYTPEIKQNITEYMSGWRYEEGVTYEPAETFEHYLRRVIRHILDSQKVLVDKAS